MIVIADAPGLKWQPNKWGMIARWRCRPDLARKGFPIKGLRLWQATEAIREPDGLMQVFIASRCRSLQADMLDGQSHRVSPGRHSKARRVQDASRLSDFTADGVADSAHIAGWSRRQSLTPRHSKMEQGNAIISDEKS